jgi:hypothetical protein
LYDGFPVFTPAVCRFDPPYTLLFPYLFRYLLMLFRRHPVPDYPYQYRFLRPPPEYPPYSSQGFQAVATLLPLYRPAFFALMAFIFSFTPVLA